jgi:5,10-methylenetetrahydrofolate reductase
LQVLTQFFINVDVFRALRERLGGLGGVPLWGGSNRIEFPEALNRRRLERARRSERDAECSFEELV